MSLHTGVLQYFVNEEIESSTTRGYTALGFQSWVGVKYQFTKNINFKGGVFLPYYIGSYFGKLRPILQLNYIEGKHEVNFGSLEGNLAHNLPEYLWNRSKLIERPLEEGLQYKYNGKRFQNDAWIDWEKSIDTASAFREEFTGGINGQYSLVKNNKIGVNFLYTALVKHRGGEIDKSSKPTTTQYNVSYGTHVEYRKNINKIVYINYRYNYYDNSYNSTPVDSFIDGNGQILSVGYRNNRWNFEAAYWESHQFQNPNGDALYHSQAEHKPNDLFFFRKMLIGRIFYTINFPKKVSLNVVGQYYYDPVRLTHDFGLEITTAFQLSKEILR